LVTKTVKREVVYCDICDYEIGTFVEQTCNKCGKVICSMCTEERKMEWRYLGDFKLQITLCTKCVKSFDKALENLFKRYDICH
jgi:hypothetical protein